jgi:hypothetical protein
MGSWDLPESAEIGGDTYEIRSDFRAVLDVLTVLGDPEITDAERGTVALTIFYPQFARMPRCCWEEAARYLTWFASGGDSPARKPSGKIVDWEQDFPIIVGPVNRILGFESRGYEHLHWWTFLAAYCEVGDCFFAQVVAIRRKRQRGERLEKHEQRFYRDNREIVDLRVRETDAEKAFFKEWMG